jgi:oligopeptide transport system substrate-binding protein
MTQDKNQSYALYQKAEEILVENAGCVPISFGESYYLVKPYVKGFYFSPLGFAPLSDVIIIK